MLRPKVLIVEDDIATCRQLEWALRDSYEVLTAKEPLTALTQVREHRPTVILLDLGLEPKKHDPEGGLQLLREIQALRFGTKVIICSAFSDREYARRAIGDGAYDFFIKPVDVDLLKSLLQRACWIHGLEQEARGGRSEIRVEDEEMIGTSESIKRIFVAIRKLATSDIPVLITGESGTGKELTAEAIHERSRRRHGPFVPINCGAIPENLLESELFGHERGAFTGAMHQKKGRIEFARGGTLFLDEIGELPLTLQVKLLRFLQTQAFERVGGCQSIEVDARIIAATNVDLRKAIENGRFREDLYYRLGVVHLILPPLRDRGEDVLLMAKVFLSRVTAQMQRAAPGFSKEAIQGLHAYHWPGNVRELFNKIRRAVVMAEGPEIGPRDLDLPYEEAQKPVPFSIRGARQHQEQTLILQALTLHNGNISHVARELGVSRTTLYRLMRRYELLGAARRS